MSHSLRVFVAGLAALVQGRDGKFHVLLPHAAHHHHAHFPILLCDPENADCRLSAANQGAEIAAHLRTAPTLTGYLLAGEEVTVRGAAAGRLEETTGRWRRRWYHDFTGTIPGSHEECADTAWIARIGAIDPARGAVAARHLERPQREEIAGKLTLAGVRGELRTFHLAEACGRVLSLTFKRPGARTPMRCYRQAVADTVVLELAADQPVTFELTTLDGGAAAGARTLTVAPKSGGSQADVLLANLSPLQEPLPCGPGFVPPPATHFALFYHLAATPMPPWEGMLPLPHCGFRDAPAERLRQPWPPLLQAVGSTTAGPQGSIERPICTVAIFDPPG